MAMDTDAQWEFAERIAGSLEGILHELVEIVKLLQVAEEADEIVMRTELTDAEHDAAVASGKAALPDGEESVEAGKRKLELWNEKRRALNGE